jgi:chitodextrinase
VTVSANSISYQTFTVPGIEISDGVTPNNQILSITKYSDQDGLCVPSGRVLVDDQITLCFINATSAAITPTQNEIYTFTIFKPNTPIIFYAEDQIVDFYPPTQPQGLTATVLSPTNIMLGWLPATDNVAVQGYEIFRNSVSRGFSTLESFNDDELTASTSYTYTVQAYDAAMNRSLMSASVSATTDAVIDTTPPSVPDNVVATPVSVSVIDITWDASTDDVGVEGYNVYRDGAFVAATVATSYQDPGLSPSTLYTYNIEAFDAKENTSAQSADATATTLADVSAPTSPSNLTATTASSSAINLAWTAATDNVAVDGYEIWQDGVFLTNTYNALTYQVSGLTAGTLYSYMVRAFDAAGNNGGFSNSASASTIGVPVNYLNFGVVAGTTPGFNLTTLAPVDWVKTGVTVGAVNRTDMAAGAGINSLTAITSALSCDSGSGNTFTWTDGDPTATGTNNSVRTESTGVGSGILFNVDLANTEQTITFYTDVYKGNAAVTVSFSDSSVAPYTYTITGNSTGTVYHKIVAVCLAAGAGVKANIRIECTAQNAVASPIVGITAVTLEDTTYGPGELPPDGNVGILQITQAIGVSTGVNLTTNGTLDWWKYGITASTYDTSAKGIVTPRQIGGAYTIVPGFDSQTTSSQTFTWTDGIPTAAGTNNAQCLVSQGTVGSGWEITIQADDLAKRVFTLYCQTYSCTSKLTATISDNSSPGLSDTVIAGNGVTTDLSYAVVFKPTNPNAYVTLRYEILSIPGATTPNLKIAASTLALAP